MISGPGNIARRETVAVAMSGGVDSSVAALLLAEQGYDVIGFTLRLHDEGDGVEAPGARRDRRCCAVEGAERARQAALSVGGRHFTVDARRAFEKAVLADFASEYSKGRTPNPCVRCNTHLKWGFLYQHARRLGADRFATGHHARVGSGPDGPVLRTALDPAKDQGYALWGIPRGHLDRTLLPIGELTKDQVRRKAAGAGLVSADVPDSQEICFVPGDDYAGWLQRRNAGGEDEDLERALQPGPIVDSSGRVLGEHAGIARYTVGQRRGLALSSGRRIYVKALEPESGTVVVTEDEGLWRDGLAAVGANWVSVVPPATPFRAGVRIRYNGEAAPAEVVPEGPDAFGVRFEEPQRAVTAGQSVVVYDGDLVLGGGVIAG